MKTKYNVQEPIQEPIQVYARIRPLINDEKYIQFNKIVSSAFNQRRKMLKNSMKSWNFSDQIIKNIEQNPFFIFKIH